MRILKVFSVLSLSLLVPVQPILIELDHNLTETIKINFLVAFGKPSKSKNVKLGTLANPPRPPSLPQNLEL